MRFIYTVFFISTLHIGIFAQTEQVLDSVGIRFNQIESLHQAGNLEKALIELEDLRWMIKREKAYIKPKHLTSAMKVYQANQDQAGALKFLTDVQTSLTNIPDEAARVALTSALISVYESRGNTEKALLLQRQLTSDSIRIQNSQMEQHLMAIKTTVDSLHTVREQEAAALGQYYKVPRNRAWLFGAMAGLIFLAMLGAHRYQYRKFSQRLDEKELELSHLRGYLNTQNAHGHIQTQDHVTPVPELVREQELSSTTTEPMKTTLPAKASHSHIPSQIDGGSSGQAYQPKHLALLVEPNRQIAMYLKSLIGSDFEVEITATITDSLEFAKSRIPDIIIIDTELAKNGSGIDLARILKQDTKTNHIPIALVTAATASQAEQELKRASADLYIPKPLLDEDLDNSLINIFKQRTQKHNQFIHTLQLWFTSAKEEPSDPFLLTLMNKIEQHIPDISFSPADLARSMQYDKQVFNRKVQALTGLDTQDIIRIMRLEKAKYLLENRVAPVHVIAGLVGYDNQGSFSRAFKEHFGDTNVLLLN